MSKLTKILAAVVLVLILVAVFGYKPFMRYLYLSKLDGPESTPEDRKAAAASLFKEYDTDALAIFTERLNTTDAGIRDAVAGGLEMVARTRRPISTKAIEHISAQFEAADAAGKLTFTTVLSNIAGAIKDARPDKDAKGAEEQAKTDADNIKLIAKALIVASDAKNDIQVRSVAVDGMHSLREPGVCVQLLRIAGTEKGELRGKARRGILSTALPESVGELLETMKSEEKDLAKDAETAFVQVRDSAKSEDLLPQLDNPSADVRRKIVEALSTRKMETAAGKGITKALRDANAEIRALAVAAVPVTGLSGPVDQLAPLVSDENEAVRCANAETLGKLRDPASFTILLQAFKNDMQGKTMEKYVLALGQRCYGREKDVKSIGIVMPLFDSHVSAENSIREAMVLLTRADQGAKRESERRQWTKDRWKKWWENIQAREKLKEEAFKELQDADSQKQGSKKLYPKLLTQTVSGLDKLEKCKDMSLKDDPEDVKYFDDKIQKYTVNRELFFKHQELDLGGGR